MGHAALWGEIMRLLQERGLSLVDLSRQSGVSRAELYRISRAEVEPSINVLRRLARALRVHPSHLIGLMYGDYVRPPGREEHPAGTRRLDSAFVGDVTYPDNSVVATGQRFRKTWEIQNLGSERWVGFRLENVDDPGMPGYLTPHATGIDLEDVGPGQTVAISVDFTAPQLPCTVISMWKLVDAGGALVFPDKVGLWCQVRVEDL